MPTSPSAQRGRPQLHWGIVGLGMIANDFVLAMAHCRHPNKVVAVATSNSVERAEQFRVKHGLGDEVKQYGTYEELMSDPDIDIVYISTMNNTHFPLVVSALEHGKSVLCEKPMVFSPSEIEAIQRVHDSINRKEDNRLFLMEGFWSRFFPAWQSIRRTVRSGDFGEPRAVLVDFCSTLPDNRSDLSMGECTLLDIGCYPIMFAAFVFEGQKVVDVKAVGHVDPEGVDKWSNVLIRFERGGHALCYCNTEVKSDSSAKVIFDGGQLELPERFWCPTELRRWTEAPLGKPIERQSEEFPFPERKRGEPEPAEGTQFVFHNSCGLNYEADHAWECIEQGKTESEVMGLEESKRIASINEQARRQIGVQITRSAENKPDLTNYQI